MKMDRMSGRERGGREIQMEHGEGGERDSPKLLI